MVFNEEDVILSVLHLQEYLVEYVLIVCERLEILKEKLFLSRMVAQYSQ